MFDSATLKDLLLIQSDIHRLHFYCMFTYRLSWN